MGGGKNAAITPGPDDAGACTKTPIHRGCGTDLPYCDWQRTSRRAHFRSRRPTSGCVAYDTGSHREPRVTGVPIPVRSDRSSAYACIDLPGPRPPGSKHPQCFDIAPQTGDRPQDRSDIPIRRTAASERRSFANWYHDVYKATHTPRFRTGSRSEVSQKDSRDVHFLLHKR